MFHSSITALVTPFKNDKIDDASYQNLIDWQIKQGTSAVVPCGTTGESPTLTHDEHHRVVELCIETAAKRVPVLAGTGSNSTVEAISLTQFAQRAGADAALVVTPYYNKPTQEGLYQHYKAIHDATNIPIIVYNIPGRSVIDMSVATLARLAELPRITGVKDATNNLERVPETRAACGDKFNCLSGEDGTVAAFLAMGGDGIVSVLSNVAPKESANLHKAWRAGDLKTFAALRDRLAPLSKALFMETNPAPIKYALSLLGLIEPSVRLPLVEVQDSTRQAVRDAMEFAGLLERKAA